MKDCHKSKELENLVGKTVEITFFDGSVQDGVLLYDTYGRGYVLAGFMSCDVRFYKSHIRKIKEVNWHD